MLIVETIGRIRREHLVKGKSIREIARDLKVSRNTVRKVLRSGETSFSYEREVQPRRRRKAGGYAGPCARAQERKQRGRNCRHAAGEDSGLFRLVPDRQTVLQDFKIWVVET